LPAIHERKKGVWYAAAAYGFWGGFPIYWKILSGIPALQLICHRIVWSCVLLVGIIGVQNGWRDLWQALRQRRIVIIYSIAALAIAINWLVFVWAVAAGFIVHIALGYFINPLFTVFLGVVFFRERLRRLEWAAIALAAAGVLYLTISYRALPWISLTLAATFGTYGLAKKVAPLGAVLGLTIETLVLFVPAALYLAYSIAATTVGFPHENALLNMMMIGAGPLTTAPLLMFAAAARRIPLSSMGMLQYINPTMQFLIGVFLYKEPFTSAQFAGFALVWAALVLFAVQGYVDGR
jgi:chloramphenicol-sensitive protein RarD